ncbi:ribosomal protein bL12 [Candidatus Vidania fulgoroideorum]
MLIERIFSDILKLNLEELCTLVKMIEDKFPSNVASNLQQVNNSNPVTTSNVNRSISLVECGPNKIAVIKLVKDITGLSLLASKKIVDSLPYIIKDSVDNKEFEAIESKFISLGCKVK